MKLGWIQLESQRVIIVDGKVNKLTRFLFKIYGPKNLHFITVQSQTCQHGVSLANQ